MFISNHDKTLSGVVVVCNPKLKSFCQVGEVVDHDSRGNVIVDLEWSGRERFKPSNLKLYNPKAVNKLEAGDIVQIRNRNLMTYQCIGHVTFSERRDQRGYLVVGVKLPQFPHKELTYRAVNLSRL